MVDVVEGNIVVTEGKILMEGIGKLSVGKVGRRRSDVGCI